MSDGTDHIGDGGHWGHGHKEIDCVGGEVRVVVRHDPHGGSAHRVPDICQLWYARL